MAKKFETIADFCKEALHNGEGGSSGGGALMVTVVDKGNSVYAFDKTWQEVHDAYVAGRPVLVDTTALGSNGISSVYNVFTTYNNDGYRVAFLRAGLSDDGGWNTNTADGYPEYTYD